MISRRGFLGAAGLAATATLGIGLARAQPRRIRRAGPTGVARFSAKRSVAVIGGGLAGLSASLELAERGAEVTLIEAAPHLGGKLGGWPVQALGRSFAMEHGFHGFFSQYYNLTDCLERLGVNQPLVAATSYPLLFADGSGEDFRGERAPFPINLLGLYARSRHLHWASAITARPEMRALLAYDPAVTTKTYDAISFAEFAAGLDRELVQVMLLPFTKTTLNHPERVSAAYALRFMHFYFLGNPEGLSYRSVPNDCMADVVTPWQRRLESLGVKVQTATTVSSLRISDGTVRAAVLGDASDTTVLARVPEDLGEETREIGRGSGGAPIFAHRRGRETIALLGTCTHQGCPVRLSATGFDCPCHGGKFDRDGTQIAGPPPRPLARLTVLQDGSVVSPPRGASEITADEFVLACDVRGARRILASSEIDLGFASRVSRLTEADPYLVVRFWLDRRALPSRATFYTVSGFALLDSIAIYDRLQIPYREYAEATGHGVIEVHAYAIDPALDAGPSANRDRIWAELQRALPELQGAKILHEEIMQQSNFSGFAPGSAAYRPGTTTPHANLHLAGDWVAVDAPVALMEAAVTSGRLAANAVCERHGVAGVTIDTVALRGVLA